MSAAIRQDVRHLSIGERYRIVRELKDYDGVVHPVGETWTFQGATFLPYEDGYTFYISTDIGNERSFRMQNRPDAQAAFFTEALAYVGALPLDPSLAGKAPPPSPAPNLTPANASSQMGDSNVVPATSRSGRFSLHALREWRKASRARYKAGAERLRRKPPFWLTGLGLLISAEFIREALHARARGESISFGHYGDYPWWFAMSLGVAGVTVFTTHLLQTLIKRIRR